MHALNRKTSHAFLAACTALSLVGPTLAGCGRGDQTASSNVGAPQGQPNYGVVPAPPQARQNKGLTTGQKVAILAGTAALMYLYDKHKNAQGHGPTGQYYQSKNGRIYYRDAQGNAVYVTPPAGGIQVPADVAAQYQQYNQPGAMGSGAGAPPGPGGGQ